MDNIVKYTLAVCTPKSDVKSYCSLFIIFQFGIKFNVHIGKLLVFMEFKDIFIIRHMADCTRINYPVISSDTLGARGYETQKFRFTPICIDSTLRNES